MSDEMQGRVFEAIKKHAKFAPNGKLLDLNVSKWNYEVSDNFGLSLRRQASFTIQRNDLGDIPEAMRNPAGRLLFQFKSFMFGSIVKQLQRGAHYRDIETFVAWSTSMMLASTVYVAQTSIDNALSSEERKKALSPEKIAGAGFSRAGWTALLVPIAATASDLAGYDGMFNHRYSGLQASLLSVDSNPTGSLVRSVLGTLTEPLDLLDDDALFADREAAKDVMNILPFNRLLGIKNALHLFDE
jgi:hypothetical protein